MTAKTATFEELQGTMRELAESQKKTEESHRKTEESLRDVAKAQQETDRQLRETDSQLRETDERLRKLDKLFNGQWSKLIESLVEGDLLNLLHQQNITVDKTMIRVKSPNKGVSSYEFDILAVNGSEVVAVEVKTTLKPKDTDYFIKKLNVFKEIFPEYSDKKIYGAVAYLKEDAHSAKYSEKQGLFVIRATGSSASIVNDKGFHPKIF